MNFLNKISVTVSLHISSARWKSLALTVFSNLPSVLLDPAELDVLSQRQKLLDLLNGCNILEKE